LTEIINIPTEEIKFLIHRPREEAEFAMIVDSIREVGILQPLKGIDISDWKPADRRRPDGGLYRYLAGFGEGRTAAAQRLYTETHEARWRTVPFIVVKVPVGELLTWFLSENFQREKLSWIEIAELLRADLKSGMTPAELAAKNHYTLNHVTKLLRVVGKASPKVMDDLRKMTVQQGETLTKLPHASQEIIVETLHEHGLHGSQMPAVVHMAQEQVAQTGTLSKAVLVRDIARLKQNVADQRKVLKLKRTHLAIGPQIYGDDILQDKKFLALLNERGIPWKPFMEEWKK
jgi:ParB-like chromosome segregation protein Spo0J